MAKLTDANRPSLADVVLFEALICLIFVQLSSAEKSRDQCVNILNKRWPTLYEAATNTRSERIQQQDLLIYLQLEATKEFLASDFHSLEAGDAETDFDSSTKKRI